MNTPLRQYIESIGGTGKVGCPILAKFAAKVGCSHQTLYVVSLGHKTPSALLAARISAATSGAVTCEQLRPDLEWHSLPDGRKVSAGPKPARKRRVA